MTIHKIIRNPKTVSFKADFDLGNDGKKKRKPETHAVTAHEVPQPAFDSSLQALTAVCGNWFDCSKKWAEKIIVRGVSITTTAQGTRSAIIHFKRPFKYATDPIQYETPSVRIDEAVEGDADEPLASEEDRNLVNTFLIQAERYAKGDRQDQLLLDLDPDGGEDDDDDGKATLGEGDEPKLEVVGS